MAVKLYNFSGLPDEPMRSILAAAKMAVGASGDVVVKVSRGGHSAVSYAKSAGWVRRWFLSSRSCTKASGRTDLKHGHVQTDGGYVVMKPRTWGDPLRCAENFFETAVHEFAHIVQFQQGNVRFARANDSGRRPAWGKRPEEIDAVNKTDDALARLAKRKERRAEIDGWIIELGIQMEARRVLPADLLGARGDRGGRAT